MKKLTIPIIALILTLFLAACTSPAAEVSDTEPVVEDTGNDDSSTSELTEEVNEEISEEAPEEGSEELIESEDIEDEPASEGLEGSEPEDSLIRLTDGLGNTIEIEGPAQRIISLAPSNTEILFAVGAGSQVVGRDALSDYPEAALEIADIGGGFSELDLETIVSLEPDLVLAADITAPEQIQALSDLGVPVFALANPIDLQGMYDNLETVAILTGHEAEAEALIADLEARVTTITETVSNAEETPLVFYELDSSDPSAPWTSGPGTFIDTLITMAGGENIGAVLDGAWVQISIEELIVQDPQIIVLGDAIYAGISPDDVAAREGWGDLTAVQTDNVVPFDDNLASRPGPRLVDGLEAMAQLFHPELFE